MKHEDTYFEALRKVSGALGTAVNSDEILDLIVESAINTMKGKGSCLWLHDPLSGRPVRVAAKGLSERYFGMGPFNIDKINAVIEKEGYLCAKDATTDPRLDHHEVKKSEGIASMLMVPVKVKGVFIGTLALYTAQPRDFSGKEIDFLTALAEQGGIAIERARLVERIRKNTKLFFDLATNINSRLDLKSIFQSLTSDISRAFGVKATSIRLLNEERGTLDLVASFGLSQKYLNKGPVYAERSIARALQGEPVVVKNAAVDGGVQYKNEKKEEGIASILCVPMKAQDRVIGVLRLYSGVPRDFTEDEIMLATALAHQGALAIHNASLYRMMEKDMKDLKNELWSHRSWF